MSYQASWDGASAAAFGQRNAQMPEGLFVHFVLT